MVVQHNMSAINTNRMLSISTKNVANLAQKLSSGYRVNRAADDAAGLSISEKMRKQIRGLTRAAANTEDGISCVQTADGALNEVHDMLQRMNELCVQAATGTVSETDRGAIQDEIDQLISEVDRVAQTTKFNDIYLLKGDSDNGVINKYIEKYRKIESNPLKTISKNNLSDYSSYQDVNGATHYVIGSGRFQIENDITGVILDISGETQLQNSKLENVTLNCAYNTNLSLLNVTIDNSAYTHTSTNGIGSAVIFNGGTSSLNTYGQNTLLGGWNSYESTMGLGKAGCGVEMKNNLNLTLNGTETSKLILSSSESYSPNGLQRSASAIGGTIFYNGSTNLYSGTNCTLTVNSGSYDFINASGSSISDICYMDNSTFNFNGGYINSSGPFLSVINDSTANFNGTSLTHFSSSSLFDLRYNSTINVNAGSILSTGHMVMDNATLNQNGGEFIFQSASTYANAISMLHNSTINIDDGYFKIQTDSSHAPIDKNTASTVTNHIYIDGVSNDGQGTSHGTYTELIYGTQKTQNIEQKYATDWNILIDNKIVLHPLYDSDGNQLSEITLNNYFDDRGEYIGGLFTDKQASLTDEIPAGENTTIWEYVNQQNLKINEATEISILAGDDSKKESTIDMEISSLTATGLGITILNSYYAGILDNNGALATDAINVIADAINRVSRQRSYLGALQNRFEHTIKNLENVVENTTNAESHIRDTDMAKEMVSFSNSQIISQSAQAMLGQANQLNQGILSILS